MLFANDEPVGFSGALEVVLKLFVIPAALYMFHLHRDMVYKIIPSGFLAMREELQRQSVQAEERHAQHIRRQDKICAAIKEQAEATKANKRPRRRKARPRGSRPTA